MMRQQQRAEDKLGITRHIVNLDRGRSGTSTIFWDVDDAAALHHVLVHTPCADGYPCRSESDTMISSCGSTARVVRTH